MFDATAVRSAAVLLAVLCAGACGDGEPAPLAGPSPVTPPRPAPPPSPGPGILAGIAGEWTLSLRLTEVEGEGCVAEALRSRIGAPTRYSLRIGEWGPVTLADPSTDFSCTFPAVAVGANGFTTRGVPGYFECANYELPVRCADATSYSMFAMGQDIAGSVSGDEITGTWVAGWVLSRTHGVGVKAEYTGSRSR